MFSENDLYWKNQVDFWKNLAKDFASACERDGFGGVRDVHMGDLSQAFRNYEKAIQGEQNG